VTRLYWLAGGLALAASPAVAADNPLHLSFHHVTVSVADLEREADWYARVLGFRRSARIDGGGGFAAYHMTLPGYRIDIVSTKGSVPRPPTAQGWLHIVFTTPDLDAAYRDLKAKGTDVRIDPDEHGRIGHLSLHDPEGNEIGLAKD
jgi:catechol 2,3-dioxygenase-like lactoylglutathione lyase family enzyme